MNDVWIVRLLQRYRPAEGWLLFTLPLAALSILPAAAASAAWVPDLGAFLETVVCTAYLLAFGLSRVGWDTRWGVGGMATERRDRRLVRNRWSNARPLAGWAAALVLAVAGVLVVSVLLGWRLAPRPEGVAPWLAPLARAALSLREMAGHLAEWASAVLTGRAMPRNLVFDWLIGLAVWAAAAWAAWWLFARHQAFAALVPAGILLALNFFYTLEGRGLLLPFLTLLLFLLVMMQAYDREQAWRRAGMDFSTEIRTDALLAAMAVAMLAFIAAAPMPRLVLRPTAEWYQALIEQPLGAVATVGRRLFPELRGQGELSLVGRGAAAGMPRAFLLGSGPELSQELVLRVRTDELEARRPGDPLPSPQYWRAATFDTYTGRGWTNGPVEWRSLDAGEPWTEPDSAHRRLLRQEVERLRSGDETILAAGEPLSSDRPYQALVRSDVLDLVAMTSRSRRYQVLSLTPAADEATLAAAGRDYPQKIIDRYGDTSRVPRRVADLAHRLTRAVDAPYRQAIILQNYLRSLPYSLAIPPPPADRDVVDYFLFEARTGYCDYYASAMVTMARSLGIPARLAVGYATGNFDAASGAYLVTADMAHSWPELYFPGIGWVPFEPTASRAALGEVGTPTSGAVYEPPQATEIAANLQSLRADSALRQRTVGVVGLLAGVVAAVAGLAWWARRPASSAVQLYSKLARWGGRLGRPALPGETAGEFGRGLSAHLEATVGGQRRQAAAGVVEFVSHFEAATYSKKRGEPLQQARRVWRWLHRQLRRLWVHSLLRRR